MYCTGPCSATLNEVTLGGVKFGRNVKIEPYVVIYDNTEIGDDSVICAFTTIFSNTKIGKSCLVATHNCLQGDCEVGDYTTLHWNVEITKKVKIGSNCFIGPRFRCSNTKQITIGKHGTKTEGTPILEGVTIGDYTVIGGDVRCIPGVTIGERCVIDMDCLITKDIPDNSKVRGGKDKIGRPYC